MKFVPNTVSGCKSLSSCTDYLTLRTRGFEPTRSFLCDTCMSGTALALERSGLFEVTIGKGPEDGTSAHRNG